MSSPSKSVLTASQLREAFLAFFEQKGHRRLASSSLVPHNDPTLLFTNAGMVQFKDVFTGREQRDYSRAATSQKCVRAGGKHNDLDNVGFTARHHTFFEMLGNFSFGDYFKKDAIAYAWEFVTQTLRLDTSRLAVTVFNGEKGLPWDEEAFQLWEQVGVAKDRIHKLGYKDNFWAMGDTGPCGPCSEIHYHQGDDIPCAEVAAGRPCQGVACDCDRWLEIWNLVFMQYERKEKDAPLIKLPKPSIDTGAGLERMAAVVQGKRTNYETDIFQDILGTVSALCGKKYGADADLSASMNVIADHSRAAAFLIADGVQPSNEGRGYVLRRIMRRAIRHGAKLGLTEVFFYKTVDRVIEVMSAAYPDLKENRSFILEVSKFEEESFRRTLDRGLRMIDEETARLQKSGQKVLPGDVVFFLHDTHGFPWDLTQVIARERGFDIDQAGYEERMKQQREKGEFGGSGGKAVSDVYHGIFSRTGETTFLGYDGEGHGGEGTIVALVKNGTEVTQATAGESVEFITDRTPFYGESGGQVGDTGTLTAAGGKTLVHIEDAQRPVPNLVVHKGKVTQGTLKVGEQVALSVDGERRKAIRANHSATHLLHKALKSVLGDHVKQAGSVVAPDGLRFDYSHFTAPSPRELEQVEDLVNGWIRDNAEASTRVMPLDEARKAGAVALFGEKYGEKVRVVSVHPESTELCGGTHVRRTGDIGLFKIVSESSIASGVRRISGVTGSGALLFLRELEHELKKAADLFRTSPRELAGRIEASQKRTRELERKLEELTLKALSGGGAAQSSDEVRDVAGMKVLARHLSDADPKMFRTLADQVRDQLQSGVVALSGEKDGKAIILVTVTKDWVQKGIHAGNLIREMAKEMGGSGGGKPDMAQAGGSDPAKLPAAMHKLYELLSQPRS